jgi:uncharacterized membrane protein
MTTLREEVSIEAPAERVWAVVHEDLENAPRWTSSLRRATLLDGHMGRGARVRYDLDLAGWKGSLEVEHDTWRRPRKAAGHFTDGPLRGSWSYSYSERAGKTRLVYEMDYQLAGMLRLLGGVLAGQYAAGIRDNMVSLKRYIEAGKGPKPK